MNGSMLEKLLLPGGLTSYAQPVVRVAEYQCDVVGVECLTRGPQGTPFESPVVLFDYVRRKKAESVVDKRAIAVALAAVAPISSGIGISVNVHASTLGRDPAFVDFLLDAVSQHEIEPSRTTVEIVEHSPVWNATQFLRNIKRMRAAKFRIALDDVGTGQSNYRMILDASPDCFKLDAYLVKGAHNDNRRRAVLASIIKLAEDMGSSVVAEGVETADDLYALVGLGVHLIQGYLFHRASPTSELLNELAEPSFTTSNWTKGAIKPVNVQPRPCPFAKAAAR
jgi:EAL domain-containing protein (putative c-di-GMP-specific phosphodiesterase class I)